MILNCKLHKFSWAQAKLHAYDNQHRHGALDHEEPLQFSPQEGVIGQIYL